ncbi:hypothetical protein RCO48_24950 [Peribacillus frigoritolerans]|nr:hypothetical protein [Peribacillus frigoritolerans]
MDSWIHSLNMQLISVGFLQNYMCYQGNRKKALQQRGLTAELKSGMPEAGTLLVVGDRNRDLRDPAHGDGD